MRDQLLNERMNYINNLFSIDNELLNSVHNSLLDKRQFIQINGMEGQILQMLIRMNGITNIVELGTLAGYSTLCMAQAIPKDGHIFTIENNIEHAKLAEKHFTKYGYDKKVTLMVGDALDKLGDLSIKSPFDMIFIDADKANYCAYLDWAEVNIKKFGIIVADNTLLFDTVFLDSPPKQVSKNSWQAMKEFNKRISNKEKYCSTLIPTEEGMTIALKLF